MLRATVCLQDYRHDIMIYLFWLSLFFVFYAYLGYIALLVVAVRTRKHGQNSRRTTAVGSTPNVSLMISAYNEEGVIEKKIQNALDLDYTCDRLEIVVISDGSNDRTNEIVSRFAGDGVVLRYYADRIGKTACLNRAVPQASGDIIVFSDANAMYDRKALRELVEHFSEERVGFVTGYTKYSASGSGDVLPSIGLYAKIELITKQLESRINSCVGADGAIFAIRKELYEPLRDVDINDFVIPLNIIRKGYQGKVAPDAFCIEHTADDTGGEFGRQARITNRTIRAIVNNRDLLNPFKYGMFSFALFSHKITKFLAPFFLATLFISNLMLVRKGVFYTIVLAVQSIAYALPLIGKRNASAMGLAGVASAVKTFVVVNCAILWGWIKYIQGHTYTAWRTAR